MTKCHRVSCRVGIALTVIATVSGAAQSAPPTHRASDATRPDAIIRASKNLTKPLARELLPNSIFNSAGTLIVRITDAVYCGRGTNDGRILAQLTTGTDTHAAANLLMADCSSSLRAVAARHQNATGFSGVASLTVTWSAWSLRRAVAEVAPATPNAFSTDQLAAIRAYSSSLQTDARALTGSGGVAEQVSLGFAFAPDAIVIGVFQANTSIPSGWQYQAAQTPDSLFHTVNAQLAIAHPFLQALLAKYHQSLSFSVPLGGTATSFSDFTETVLPGDGPPKAGMRLQATAVSSSASFCKIHLTTDWLGTPLALVAASAKGDPASGLCAALATSAGTEMGERLRGKAFVAGSAHDFHITLGDRPASLHFVGAYSVADPNYLSLFGNGAVNAE